MPVDAVPPANNWHIAARPKEDQYSVIFTLSLVVLFKFLSGGGVLQCERWCPDSDQNRLSSISIGPDRVLLERGTFTF